jgi:hypothetical protein
MASPADNLRLCYGKCTAETAGRGIAELAAWRDRFLVDLQDRIGYLQLICNLDGGLARRVEM